MQKWHGEWSNIWFRRGKLHGLRWCDKCNEEKALTYLASDKCYCCGTPWGFPSKKDFTVLFSSEPIKYYVAFSYLTNLAYVIEGGEDGFEYNAVPSFTFYAGDILSEMVAKKIKDIYSIDLSQEFILKASNNS